MTEDRDPLIDQVMAENDSLRAQLRVLQLQYAKEIERRKMAEQHAVAIETRPAPLA